MGHQGIARLRVLVTDGPGVRLDEVTRTIGALGHDVIARESSLPDVAQLITTERPDVAVVIVHEGTDKALELIDRIVHEAACPVIAVLDVQDRDFINEAAKRGIFAYLEGAFGRRAVTERAKGILMERHDVDEGAAFDMLRQKARQSNRKLVDIADSVVTSRSILPAPKSDSSSHASRA